MQSAASTPTVQQVPVDELHSAPSTAMSRLSHMTGPVPSDGNRACGCWPVRLLLPHSLLQLTPLQPAPAAACSLSRRQPPRCSAPQAPRTTPPGTQLTWACRGLHPAARQALACWPGGPQRPAHHPRHPPRRPHLATQPSPAGALPPACRAQNPQSSGPGAGSPGPAPSAASLRPSGRGPQPPPSCAPAAAWP